MGFLKDLNSEIHKSQRPSQQSSNGHASMSAWLVARGNKTYAVEKCKESTVLTNEICFHQDFFSC